ASPPTSSSTPTARCVRSASRASTSSTAPSTTCSRRRGGRGRDVARIRAQPAREQERARRKGDEHDGERPLQTCAPAAEDVVRHGAEDERRKRLCERTQQRADRFRTTPEPRRHDVEPRSVERWVLGRQKERRGDEVHECRACAAHEYGRREEDRREGGGDRGGEDAAVEESTVKEPVAD